LRGNAQRFQFNRINAALSRAVTRGIIQKRKNLKSINFSAAENKGLPADKRLSALRRRRRA